LRSPWRQILRLATIAVFPAAFKDWRRYLAPGEVGVIMIIAADRRQARVIMRYCTGLLKETRETIELRNRITIESRHRFVVTAVHADDASPLRNRRNSPLRWRSALNSNRASLAGRQRQWVAPPKTRKVMTEATSSG
jgi:tRNA threonylcarbamoyladenosine modification (KEOPS) complex  Pcc1 subunit